MKYIPQSSRDQKALLEAIGLDSVEELFAGIPENLRVKDDLSYPKALSELELRRYFQELVSNNRTPDLSFAGCGVYHHDVPSIVPFLQSRSEYATAYTPYQPEISQGLLQAIFEFQTLACQLTETELSNASLYDGATSFGEALLMGLRIKKKSQGKILISQSIHPHYRHVLNTYGEHFVPRFEDIPLSGHRMDLEWLETRIEKGDVDFVLTQSPNIFGSIEDYSALAKLKAKYPELFWISSTMETLSWAFLRGPGAYGCDIVTGEGQSFGNPAYLAGAGYGFFCTRQEFIRNLPGRLVGETTDQDGKRSFVLTFATREQFIRRGRATSNICTNNNLNMLAGLIHLCSLGKEGLKELAQQNFSKCQYLKSRLASVSGVEAVSEASFNEFTISLNKAAAEVFKNFEDQNIIPGVDLGRLDEKWKHKLLIHVNETHSRAQLDQFVEIIQKSL